MTEPILKTVEVRSIMSKSNLPVCEYSVNPYTGCTHGCKYCYANYNDDRVKEMVKLYDEKSPLLCGYITADDRITDRKVRSLKDMQISFFD